MTFLSLAGCLRPNPFFLLSKLRGQFHAEILCSEHLADLDFTVFIVRIGAALDPLNRPLPC
jgi:hypothetical protein